MTVSGRLGGLILLLWMQTATAGSAETYDARAFGARGDGVALDSGAINRAIAACAASGGGTVRLPPGDYRAGTLFLRSGVTLEIDRYAVLHGSKNLADYTAAVYPGGSNEALILAHGVDGAAVIGDGVIDGSSVFNPRGEEGMRGPHAVVFYDCRDVAVRGVRIRRASNWAVMFWSCRGVQVEGLDIQGGWDGVNMHDVLDAAITDCRFQTGDDCLAGSYWENVTVRGCVLNSSANAIRVSGRNVTFADCLIYGPGEYAAGSSLRHRTEAGFQILPNRRDAINKYATKGPADNVVLTHVTMIDVGTPAWIDSSRGSTYNPDNLGIGRIVFDHVRVVEAGRTPFYAAADPDRPGESIVLRHVQLLFSGGGDESQAQGQGFSPFSVLQAYGFYCRNFSRVDLDDVAIGTEKGDGRPPLAMENVGALALEGVSAERAKGLPLLVGSGIGRLTWAGQAIPSGAADITAVDAPAEALAGDPWAAAVEAIGSGPASWCPIVLRLGQERIERDILFGGSDAARLTFLNLRAVHPGSLTLEADGIRKAIVVRPRPDAQPVGPPFRAFRNIDAVIEQEGSNYYIRAKGDHVVLQQGDQYGAIYQPRSLGADGTIIVRLVNPDLRTGWMGRAGIMVRNGIDEPGRAGGYLVVSSSPAAGSYLEWESDGAGRLNRHTDFDGYTIWPHWLKLERHGAEFSGYRSLDGQNWTLIGRASLPDANPRLDAGVFAFRDSARFENFRIAP